MPHICIYIYIYICFFGQALAGTPVGEFSSVSIDRSAICMVSMDKASTFSLVSAQAWTSCAGDCGSPDFTGTWG